MYSEHQPDTNSADDTTHALDDQVAGGGKKDDQPPAQVPQVPAKVESAAPVSEPASTEEKPKKPKTPPRTPAKKAYDELVAARKKIDEKIEEARVKMIESDCAAHFHAGQQMMHKALLGADRQSRESAVASLQMLLPEEDQKVLMDYLMAFSKLPPKKVASV